MSSPLLISHARSLKSRDVRLSWKRLSNHPTRVAMLLLFLHAQSENKNRKSCANVPVFEPLFHFTLSLLRNVKMQWDLEDES